MIMHSQKEKIHLMPSLHNRKSFVKSLYEVERAFTYTDPSLNYMGELKGVKIINFEATRINGGLYHLRVTINGRSWYEFEIGMTRNQICTVMEKLEIEYEKLLTSDPKSERILR